MKKSVFALMCAGVFVAALTISVSAQETKTVKYSVSMSCEKCVEKITENVSFEKGVKDLDVCLADKTVEVTYDPSKTDERTLSESISKLGYEVDTVKVVDKTKETAEKVGDKTKETAVKVGDKTKETAEKVGDKTKDTAEKVGDKTVETADKVGDKTKETAEKVGDKTKETAEKVGDKTKDAANKVGDFFKKDKDKSE